MMNARQEASFLYSSFIIHHSSFQLEQPPVMPKGAEHETLDLFLIEDEDAIALLMRRCLERAGHRVTRCRTAADALIVLGQCPFDLALLDQILPDMEGIDLLEALAQENISVPILMVTAYGNQELA